jgi:hypothetical protein
MAKQTEYRFSKQKREQMIKNCEECKGAPETEPFNLQGMCGAYCTKCCNVVDWVKTGILTKITTKVEAVVHRPTNMSEVVQIEIEEIPGTEHKDIKFRSMENNGTLNFKGFTF